MPQVSTTGPAPEMTSNPVSTPITGTTQPAMQSPPPSEDGEKKDTETSSTKVEAQYKHWKFWRVGKNPI